MFPWPAAVHRLQIPAIRLQIPAMSTTDSGWYDYKFQLCRLQIPAVIHRYSAGKEFFLSPQAPLERHKSETTRIAKLSTTNSGYWLVMSARVVRAGEHLITNSADF